MKIYIEEFRENSKEIEKKMETMHTAKDIGEVDKLLTKNQEAVRRCDVVGRD